jgi:hypothetical protein
MPAKPSIFSGTFGVDFIRSQASCFSVSPCLLGKDLICPGRADRRAKALGGLPYRVALGTE